MDKHTCCICGKHIGALNTYYKTYKGYRYLVCSYCSSAFMDSTSKNPKKVESGKKHLRSNLEQGLCAPEAILMVKEILGVEATDEEINASVSNLSGLEKTENPPSDSTGKVAYLAGTLFLAAAVILYFVSTNNSYGVANIQTTVFSAAAFVSGIICLAAGKIISLIQSK